VIYLSGSLAPGLAELGGGYLLTPRMRQRPPAGAPWAADSGCYSRATYVGDAAYLAWLARMAPERGRCLFATVPDVVGDHAATLAAWPALAPAVAALGYRPAFVAQDGATAAGVPWDELGALFVGGSTGWKLSEAAYSLGAEARARGVHLHVGRVNSERRLRAWAAAGADSCDGTLLAFGPDRNLPQLAGWLARLRARPTLLG
jgi:hypothetical protein